MGDSADDPGRQIIGAHGKVLRAHSITSSASQRLVAQPRERGIAVVDGLREGLSAIDHLARLASRANSEVVRVSVVYTAFGEFR